MKGKASSSTITAIPISSADDLVTVLIPDSAPVDAYDVAVHNGVNRSQIIAVNAPQVSQLEFPEIASGDAFRVFGRNLAIPGKTTSLFMVDNLGNQLAAAVTSASEYSLTAIMPTVVAGRTYSALVNNGAAAGVSSTATMTGRAGGGTDYFGLGAPWGRDFVTTVYNATTDTHFAHAVGDGVTDNRAAIQAGVDYITANGGGILYFPAGNYKLAYGAGGVAIYLKSNVVLQGHSAADTTITYGPTSDPGPAFCGIIRLNCNTAAVTNAGIADLTLTNIDSFSSGTHDFDSDGSFIPSKIFIQRVNWSINSGYGFTFANGGDRFLFLNSTFTAGINTFNPSPPYSPYSYISGKGPFYLIGLTNSAIRNNSVSWTTEVGFALLQTTNAIIEGNRFTRSASDKLQVTSGNIAGLNRNPAVYPVNIGDMAQRQLGRHFSIDMSKNIVISNNQFLVSDGVLAMNMNDGEIINSEGRSTNANRDTATVSSSTSTTVTASAKGGTWHAGPFTKIAIVSGTGRGQWRNITAFNAAANTVTVDVPYDILPAAGDHFVVFTPSTENALILDNMAEGNPSGILMYAACYDNNVIAGNTFTDNGGIFLQQTQDVDGVSGYSGGTHGVNRNTSVLRNTLTDTLGRWWAAIDLNYSVTTPVYLWGTGCDGIDVRDNSIQTVGGTPFRTNGLLLGYGAYARKDNAGAYLPASTVAPAHKGIIFQRNIGTNLPNAYNISTGADNTIIYDAIAQTSVSDPLISSEAAVASTGTVTGRAASDAVPVNSIAPKINWSGAIGEKMVAFAGAWLKSPTSITYQWKKDGVNIAGATSNIYTPVAGDSTHTITVTVTATNGQGSTAATSAGVLI